MIDENEIKLKQKKYNELYMDIAFRISQMSYAKRLQVGSILVKDDNIISFGWNGMPSGFVNDCEHIEYTYDERDVQNSTDWNFDKKTKRWFRLKTKDEVLHSEQNLLIKLSKSTISSKDAVMYITHAPCISCSKLIFQSGIRKVFYRNSYREDKGLTFLFKCGVEIEKI